MISKNTRVTVNIQCATELSVYSVFFFFLLNPYWTFNKRNIVIPFFKEMCWNTSREWHCVKMLLKLADNAELAQKIQVALNGVSVKRGLGVGVGVGVGVSLF